jgi:hypothetical protein
LGFNHGVPSTVKAEHDGIVLEMSALFNWLTWFIVQEDSSFTKVSTMWWSIHLGELSSLDYFFRVFPVACCLEAYLSLITRAT